jgi:hypothetical protein
MKYVGKSKIGKVSPKPNVIYPFIRLPQQYIDAIGEKALIFETEHDGKKAFFISLTDEDEFDSDFDFEKMNSLSKSGLSQKRRFNISRRLYMAKVTGSNPIEPIVF